MKRIKRSLICVGLGTIVSTAAFSFTAPEQAMNKSNGVFVGHKVIRPTLSSTASNGLMKSVGNNVEIKTDKKSNVVRVLSGKLFTAKQLKAGQNVQSFITQSKNFIAENAAVFGSLNPANLIFVKEALVFDKKDQFLKFSVMRDGLIVEDATVDFRYKFGTLVQVVNSSFSEASYTESAGKTNTKAALTSQFAASAVKFTGQKFRVVENKKGYQLIKIDSYQMNESGEIFSVQVNKANGAVYEKNPQNHYISGQANGTIYRRYWEDPRSEAPFSDLYITLNNDLIQTNSTGGFEADENAGPKITGLKGDKVNVRVKSGSLVNYSAAIEDGAFALDIRSETGEERYADKDLAQAMIFYHTNLMIDVSKRYISSSWFGESLVGNANLSSTCNAHWDGSTINFYSADTRCANTALISDVIYHEWGHGLDANTGGIADGAYSEGFGDILSLLMTRSNILGIGFRLDGSPVRDLEPNKYFPEDRGEVHAEGLIIGSTMWDLYKLMEAKYGADEAVDILLNLNLKTIKTASKYTDVYDAFLVIDDDDADLENGTPNLCLINEAFALHGLADTNSGCLLGSIDSIGINETTGNGNGVIEPGESLDMQLSIYNNTGMPITGLNGKVKIGQAVEGVSLGNADLTWDDIASDEVGSSTNAAGVNIATTVACGTQFDLVFDLKSTDREAALKKTFLVGKLVGEAGSFSATGLPVDVLDMQTVTADLLNNGSDWAEESEVHNARLKFDITHTYIGDVSVNLVSPNGDAVEVFKGSGATDDVHFDADVSAAVAGKLGKGTWKLEVKDKAQQDQGTLDTFELTLTPANFECLN